MSRIIREAQPSEAVISAGMEPNGGFVIEDGGKIVGYFGFLPSPELTHGCSVDWDTCQEPHFSSMPEFGQPCDVKRK